MKIRHLDPSEYGRLKGMMDTDDWIPDHELSSIVVAEDGGEIVGFWVCQYQIHCEPVWIKEGYRSGTVLGRMYAKMRKSVAGTVFAFSERPDTADYLRRLGFHKTGYEIYQKG